MIQKRGKPTTPGRNAWRESQQQTGFQRGCKHASESTAGGPRKPHAWHAPPHICRAASDHTASIKDQWAPGSPLVLTVCLLNTHSCKYTQSFPTWLYSAFFLLGVLTTPCDPCKTDQDFFFFLFFMVGWCTDC